MPGKDREITMRLFAEPTDLNFGGQVHGGAVMKWIDQAAYACAASWSGKYAVTVYMGGLQFKQPIHVGNVVEIAAKLIYTGRTSMHIWVEVRAADPRDGVYVETTHCITVFVALDEDRKPTPVPEWVPQTEYDKTMHRYAAKLMELRQGIEEEMNHFMDQQM